MTDSHHYYTAAATRELDRIAINEFGIPGFTLMQRAAKAALDALLIKWPDTRSLIVCCGTGNNGGDGLVMAALATDKGLTASVLVAGDPANFKGDAARAKALAESRGIGLHPPGELPCDYTRSNTVMVDALLGTGLGGEVKAPYSQVIQWINASDLPVCAVDIPSGLCSDTGKVLGCCVTADITCTFIARKLGQVCGEGPQHCATVLFDDLGIPAAVYSRVKGSQQS